MERSSNRCNYHQVAKIALGSQKVKKYFLLNLTSTNLKLRIQIPFKLFHYYTESEEEMVVVANDKVWHFII